MTKQKNAIYYIALVGVFAALVFVASILSVPVPAAFGMTRIHLGNIFCLLSGFVLGPVGGGLAAGIGSGLYDVIIYGELASAPFTFAFKFLLAAVCGWLAWTGGAQGGNQRRNIAAAIAGSATYVVLYLAKSFFQGLLLGSELGTVLTALLTKLITSCVNAAIAVAVSVPLYAVVRLALKKSGLMKKIDR